MPTRATARGTFLWPTGERVTIRSGMPGRALLTFPYANRKETTGTYDQRDVEIGLTHSRLHKEGGDSL
jgi:hypothetical protein